MCDTEQENKVAYLKERIEEFQDFPKKGIGFLDIFSALTDPKACLYVRDLLVQHVRTHHPDVQLIVGLDARGFLFNLLVATELGIGCAAIRKKGKLPGETIAVEYQLEYGSDIFEIQKAAIKPTQKVLLIDDLLATGGSLEAAVKLVRKAGGDVVECLVIMELLFLNGRKRLDSKVHSLIQY